MKLVERNEYLETLCKDKSVLHLGAAEGIDTREANKEKNNWLHGRLRKVCKKLVGYDLYPQDEPDIIGGDIEETPHYGEYDYIIMGELIEHLSNPGEALWNLRYAKGELVITTPNVFSIRKFFWACLNKEVVSNSHTCYYSFKTLEYLLTQWGYQVTQKLIYAYLGEFGYFQKAFYKLFPMLTDGIIVHAKKNTIATK